MGAKANHSKVELMVNYREFFQRVGAIKNYYELEQLGLKGHDLSGLFIGSLLPQLLRFLSDHPNYHLISSTGIGRFANRFCENADAYLIAKGDRDPLLELNFLLDPQWPLIYEEGMAAAIAEINQVKNGRDS
ncbi:MAG: hypothetical protein FJ146_19925 [Deltaproteobacteria bacterium]|nr:hypothetical protein [Deltaproteobacteria bacterium]